MEGWIDEEKEITYWAGRYLGDGWLVLKVGIAPAGGPTTVTRDDIRLHTPGGRTVEALDQNAFRSVRGHLRVPCFTAQTS